MSGRDKITYQMAIGMALGAILGLAVILPKPPLPPPMPPMHLVTVTIDGRTMIVPVLGTNVSITVSK